MIESLIKCQPSQVLALSCSFGVCIESQMRRLCPWKVLFWIFLVFFFVFSHQQLPLSSPCPYIHHLPSTYSLIHTLNTHTQNLHIHSSEHTPACPQRGHPQGCEGNVVWQVLHEESCSDFVCLDLPSSPFHSLSEYGQLQY